MKDIYIVFIYFLFSNLIFLKERDIDLFMELENQLSYYMFIGDIFLFGDFNSRIKILFDYIVNDQVYEFVLDNNL